LDSQKQEKESILYALHDKKSLKSAAEFLDVTREYLRSRIRALKIEFNNEITTNPQNKRGHL
jgi:transcriptional regulator with GAF, ATPase, and Fis domain